MILPTQLILHATFAVHYSHTRVHTHTHTYIQLAIQALSLLSTEVKNSTKLIIAGGYDSRVLENVEYHQELIRISAEEGACKCMGRWILVPESDYV